MSNWSEANPTKAGMQNHLGGPRRKPPTIEGLRLEDGHGHLPIEQQLAEHVLRIKYEDSDDAAWKMRDRLLVANGVNRSKFEDELVARGLLTRGQKKDAAAN
jgi:hypothetical protein